MRCPQCRLPQVRLIDTGGIDLCAPCAIHEINIADQDNLATILPLMSEKRICAYCGEFGEEIEHVVPRWTGLPTWTVWACAECNRIALGRVFGCFAAKRDFIRKRLVQKYAKYVRMPEWTEDEIESMRGRMKCYIRGCAIMRQWVLQRIEFDVAVMELLESTFRRSA